MPISIPLAMGVGSSTPATLQRGFVLFLPNLLSHFSLSALCVREAFALFPDRKTPIWNVFLSARWVSPPVLFASAERARPLTLIFPFVTMSCVFSQDYTYEHIYIYLFTFCVLSFFLFFDIFFFLSFTNFMNDGYVWDEIRGGKKEKTRKIKGNIRKKQGSAHRSRCCFRIDLAKDVPC